MDGTRDMAGHSSAGRDYRYPQDSDPRMAPQQESDPLAELARLIGQTDPFSNLERPDTRAAQAHDEREPAYHDETYASQDQYEAEPEPEPPPPPAWLQNAQHAQQAHLQQAWAQAEQPAPSVYEPHPEDRQFVEAQRAHAHSAYPQEDTRYDEALYGRDPNAALYAHEATKAMRDPGPPYAYEGHEQGYDEYEPEEQGSRRRGGLMTVAAVLTLAVVGTAGAFAYRSYTSGPQGEPPVIRADASPSKVVPPAPSKDPSGKVITDRIGQSGERVVSREEQPVDVASNAAASGPRVVFPPLTQNNGAPPARSTSNQPAAQANAAMSGGVMEEPKKIRTLSIKSDQAESPAGASAPAPQAVAPAVPVPPRTAPIAPVQTQAQGQAQPPAQRAPAASNGGPMQLSPGAASNTRTAAVAPPASITSAPSQGSSGYFVQVSSQRSEGDALASFRAMQAKFPSALGTRQATIRRADLAAGTYYRAMVGPFASSEDATQMCASLKAAGGVCLVQRN
jgi:hypothetical protein